MKREILFRGKSTIKNEWEYGVPVFAGLNNELAFMKQMYSYDCQVDPATVGQYTGLNDKNGQRIFEGDICRNTKTSEIVSVKWHGTMAGFVWSKRKENSHLSDFGELFRACDKYEVIGNIYDNPELLEGGGHE